MQLVVLLSLVTLAASAIKGKHDRSPVKDTAMTIDEAIMSSLKSKGIKPSNHMKDKDTGRRIAELDMILTPEQERHLYGPPVKGNITKRKAVGGDHFRWTNGIVPYEINRDEYSDYEINEMREAFDIFEEETCLIFRPATSSDVNKLWIQDGHGGCNAQLGMVGGQQFVNLDKNGCRFMGLYFHEFGHALGLVHEHQLPTRDDHVTILWHNVDPYMKSAFNRYRAEELERFGIPYDLTSVMHYGVGAFGNLGAQTIKARDLIMENRIGRVFWKMMSFTDVKILNKMYECDKKCGHVDCPGEGFVNKECECVTPQSYYDSHCYNVEPDEKCLEWVLWGECQSNAHWMGYRCRKACDECPKYKIPKKQVGDCYNDYYDEAQCEKWAAEGQCERYPSFMKRRCSKACGSCGVLGKCSNTNWRDRDCDVWAENGECETNPIWMKGQCADSCNACDWRRPGECKNTYDDARCERAAKDGDCDDLSNMAKTIDMLKNCEKSCNSCFFDNGDCENIWSDDKCEKLAATGECDANPQDLRMNCRKTCDSCNYAVKGDCQNFHGDGECERWAAELECDNNPRFMKYECARDCNSCEYLDPDACLNSHANDKECNRWADAGECSNNPVWMSENCAKACGTGVCGNGGNTKGTTAKPEVTTKGPSTDGCVDKHENCEMWANTGQCVTGAAYMNEFCRKACGLCGCRDTEKDCAAWANAGHCQLNPTVMKVCPLSCGQC